MRAPAAAPAREPTRETHGKRLPTHGRHRRTLSDGQSTGLELDAFRKGKGKAGQGGGAPKKDLGTAGELLRKGAPEPRVHVTVSKPGAVQQCGVCRRKGHKGRLYTFFRARPYRR